MKRVNAYLLKDLKKVSLYSWLIKLISIPIHLILAYCMATLVSYATNGEVQFTVKFATAIIIGYVSYKAFEVIINIAYEKSLSKTLQKCKIKFYHRILDNPISLLHTSEYGELIENITNDFTTITGKNTSLYPTFYTSIITVIAYIIFLAGENVTLSLILFAISSIQIIPPLIIKRFLQVNYDNCRDIEAKLTNFALSGYNGFDTIKMFGLKSGG